MKLPVRVEQRDGTLTASTDVRAVRPLTDEEREAWREMTLEVYRERDEQKRLEFSAGSHSTPTSLTEIVDGSPTRIRAMQLPVWMEERDGTFTASAIGVPHLRGTGETKYEALAALRAKLICRVAVGDLTFVDVEPNGLLAAAGAFKDDPTLDDIVREAYRYRDELKAQEFPE